MISLFRAMLAATGSMFGSISGSGAIGIVFGCAKVGEANLLPRLDCILDPEPEFDSEPDPDLLLVVRRSDLLVLAVAELLLAEDLGLCNSGGGTGRGRGDSNPESLCGWKASKKGWFADTGPGPDVREAWRAAWSSLSSMAACNSGSSSERPSLSNPPRSPSSASSPGRLGGSVKYGG